MILEGTGENCFPWHCWHNWERGVKRVVQKGGGGTYRNFGFRKSKKIPPRTDDDLQPLIAQNSVLPLGGCGDEIALWWSLGFSTGLLNDSNFWRTGHEGFSDWRAQLQPRVSDRIPARHHKNFSAATLPRFVQFRSQRFKIARNETLSTAVAKHRGTCSEMFVFFSQRQRTGKQ